VEQYIGKTTLQKMAIGKIFYYKKKLVEVKRKEITDIDREWKRFDDARAEAGQQLQALYEKAVKEVGEAEASIFEVHLMMLQDEDYEEGIRNIITNQGLCAEYAVEVTGDNFSNMFRAMDDEYMKARATDVKDISNRIVSILCGNQKEMHPFEEPVILVADDLAPSDTVQLDKQNLLGLVTRYGSSNSHTAILAKTMNIPLLIDVDISKEWNNRLAIINGYEGTLVIDPEEDVRKEAEEKLKQDVLKQELLQNMKGKETITQSGKKINLYANIGDVSDLDEVQKNDAEGIGLFRSEFIYLKSSGLPTEQEQFLAYKTVAQAMGEKKVIIRTLDIGADKQVDYLNLPGEENPALGYRAIRICLTQKEIFKTQLRAILRASAYGNISIMIPMIISLAEVREVKQVIEEVKEELRNEAIEYKDVEFGVMIETPAAVMISEELAKEVDFFSIGTNDLTQYTLAIDRQNPKLDNYYNPYHEAVLRMIQMTIENGHKAGIWVGICGELGADLKLTETFIKMGVDELSVSPSCVLPIRDKVRAITE
jgi:phosphotransferase system enzyme I (PtsI)